MGRDSAVTCMLRGTCQFAKLLHHKCIRKKSKKRFSREKNTTKHQHYGAGIEVVSKVMDAFRKFVGPKKATSSELNQNHDKVEKHHKKVNFVLVVQALRW